MASSVIRPPAKPTVLVEGQEIPFPYPIVADEVAVHPEKLLYSFERAGSVTAVDGMSVHICIFHHQATPGGYHVVVAFELTQHMIPAVVRIQNHQRGQSIPQFFHTRDNFSAVESPSTSRILP